MERQKISVIFPYFMKGLSKSEQKWFAIMRIITRCVIYDERMKGKSGGGYIMSDKICSSADKVLEVFLENAPMDTSHHRMVKQQNKCGYGLQGVCCRLCSNGPCRL